MVYNDPLQHQQQQPPPPPPQHFRQQQPEADFLRGPPPQQQQSQPPPPMVRHPSASSTNMNPEFHHPAAGGPPPHYDAHGDSYGAKRMRKLTQRRAVDYTSTVVRYMQIRMWQRDSRDRTVLQATPAAAIDMLPTVAYSDNPSTSFAAKFVHTSLNKNRCSINQVLAGHGWDVKSVDWHPTKSLLVSGGKDNLVKLWDAKRGKELCSFHGHKNTVLCVKWNQNGNWVLTASKDQIIKLYDIRAMKELESFRGHRKDVTALAWHPFHEEYFVSGSFDGSIFHWLVGHDTPQIEIPNAHDNSVWDLAWHPIGYLLCSGSNDHTTKFWCRNRPGDTARDKFSMGMQGYAEQNPLAGRVGGNFAAPEGPATPGAFPPGLTRNEGTIPGVGVAMPLSIPSLDASQGELKQSHPASMGAPPLPPGPHPSLLAANQQQPYQQNPQQIPQHQHQGLPQQMGPLSMPPPNMQQLQHMPHMPLLPHPHMPRPPPQMPQLGMPGSLQAPSSGPSSHPMPMGMQGAMNQMRAPGPQGPFVGMNQMHSGSIPTSGGPPVGGFPSNLHNMQGPNAGGYPQGGSFNRPQGGQMPLMQGYPPYQSGNQPGMPPNAPHSQQPQ